MNSFVSNITPFLLKYHLFRPHNIVNSLTILGSRYISNYDNISTEVRKYKEKSFSTLEKPSSVLSTDEYSISSTEYLDKFAALYPDIIQELIEYSKSLTGKHTSDWLKRALEYNVPNGTHFRSQFTILVYKNLVRNLTPINVKLAHILGWCIELHQTALLMGDDIMDESLTRRNKPCWYKVNGVGLVALNDALMFEQCMYFLFKKHLGHLDCYMDIINELREISFITSSGQCLDVITSKQSVATFTREMALNIALNKTSYYMFMPVACAMYLAGCKDVEAMRKTKDIILKAGILYQVQDDFLDCFGAAEVTGKVGSDIKDNKCSWLAAECMHRANEKQKAIMLECYGKDDPEKVARVKQLYLELDLPAVYADYEKKKFDKIKQELDESSYPVPKETIFDKLNLIFERKA